MCIRDSNFSLQSVHARLNQRFLNEEIAEDFRFKDYWFAPKPATDFAFLLHGEKRAFGQMPNTTTSAITRRTKDHEVNRRIVAGTSKHRKINSDQQERLPSSQVTPRGWGTDVYGPSKSLATTKRITVLWRSAKKKEGAEKFRSPKMVSATEPG